MVSGKKIDTVVFDLDGTLLDTLEDLAASVNFALVSEHYKARSLKEIRQFLGNGIGSLMRQSMPANVSDVDFQRCFHTFRTHYLVHCLDKTHPYEGVMALLGNLWRRRYRLAIVSNKLQPAVTDLNNRFFRDFVSVAIGESEDVRRKPAPDAVFKALHLLSALPENAIYVGDSEVDLRTANNSGLPCISVLWGFRDRQILLSEGAQMLAERPSDILDILETL